MLFPLLANDNFCVLLILFADQLVRVNYCQVTNLDVIILIFSIWYIYFLLLCAIVQLCTICARV